MQKIKQFAESDKGKDILTVIIIILVGLGAFELGRLSKGNPSTGVKIEYEKQEASAIRSLYVPSNIPKPDSPGSPKNFFASSRGSKYYSVSCGAGKTIKEENRVYFTTSGEAEKAGYELSGSCK